MIKMKADVKSDMKEIDSLLRRVDTLSKYEVEYGYFAGDIHQNSGMDISDLAFILNEDRPFVDMAKDDVKRYFQTDQIYKHQIWQYLRGKGRIIELLKDFGKVGELHIQNNITLNAELWPNAPWWADVKFERYGKSTPLIETGELFNSVDVKVSKVG